VLVLSLGMGAALPATGAYAINWVPCFEDCYLMISSSSFGNTCYANAGQTELDIDGAWHVWSGNNAGYIDIYKGSGTTRYVFPKWVGFKVDGYADYLHIN
jgi:hypothetical protein